MSTLPSYADIAFALCDMMDGIQDHHITDETGLPSQRADEIAKIRAALRESWINEDRTFGGRIEGDAM